MNTIGINCVYNYPITSLSDHGDGTRVPTGLLPSRNHIRTEIKK